MKQKRKNRVVPIDISTPARAEVPILDLLAAVEAGIERLGKENRRLAAAIQRGKAKAKPKVARKAASKAARKAESLGVALEPTALEPAALEPTALEPTAHASSISRPKRPALGRGLAQLFNPPRDLSRKPPSDS